MEKLKSGWYWVKRGPDSKWVIAQLDEGLWFVVSCVKPVTIARVGPPVLVPEGLE